MSARRDGGDGGRYTVDPVIEELVKLLPLALLWWLLPAARRQWGLTDLVVLGAAVGGGFATTDALLRYADDAARAIGTDGRWVLPVGLPPPFVPGPGSVLTSWLPSPVQQMPLFSSQASDSIDPHLVWTAVAALGLGLLLRPAGQHPQDRRIWRAAGVALVVLPAADHAGPVEALDRLGRRLGATPSAGPDGTHLAVPGLVVTALESDDTEQAWAREHLGLTPTLSVVFDVRVVLGGPEFEQVLQRILTAVLTLADVPGAAAVLLENGEPEQVVARLEGGGAALNEGWDAGEPIAALLARLPPGYVARPLGPGGQGENPLGG